VNSQAIITQVTESSNLIHHTRPDVTIVTELWLTSLYTNADIFPKGFNVYHRDGPGQSGGGVFIAISKDFTALEVPELTIDCETVWMKVKSEGCRTLVCCYYDPPPTKDV